MNKYNLFTFCAIWFFLSPFSAMAAPDVKVFVRSETVGTEIIFYYTMTRSGPEEIRGLGIGVKPAGDYACNSHGRCGGNYLGTLKVLPIGTTWGLNPAIMANREFPTIGAGSTTQPAGWTATAEGGRAPGKSSEEGSAIGWDVPPWETTYPAPFVQQSIYQFSVRVPAGPISTAEYASGFFTVKYRHQDMDQNFYASVTVIPSAPAVVTVPLITTTGQATISWTPVVGAVQYRFEESDNLLSPRSGVTGTITNLIATYDKNRVYYYRVRACIDETNEYSCSAWREGSNPISVSMPSPGTPTGLTVKKSTLSTGMDTVSWNAVLKPSSIVVPLVVSYDVETSENIEISPNFTPSCQEFFKPYASYNGPNLTVELPAPAPGYFHCHQVRACIPFVGCSKSSDPVLTVVPLAIPGVPPVIFSPLPFTGPYPFVVSWEQSIGLVTRYELDEGYTAYRRPYSSVVWKTIYSGLDVSVDVAGKTNGLINYYYRVRACNDLGCSAYRSRYPPLP